MTKKEASWLSGFMEYAAKQGLNKQACMQLLRIYNNRQLFRKHAEAYTEGFKAEAMKAGLVNE